MFGSMLLVVWVLAIGDGPNVFAQVCGRFCRLRAIVSFHGGPMFLSLLRRG
jgi:lipid-A-disaccharide synthase-like uncharacterized protein